MTAIQLRFGAGAPSPIGGKFDRELLANPLLSAAGRRKHESHRMWFESDPTKVPKKELLVANVLHEDNYLGRFGHLLPSPGYHFGGLEIGLVGQKLCCTRLAILFPEEPKPIEPGPLIQRLRMM
jgi:hypothetical protein